MMAAGLANPELLARWRRDPAVLRAAGFAPGDVDLDGLWKFAGLSEKIRHNPCRDDLSLTFRLLSKLGLEIEVFASYAPRSAERRRAGKGSVADKIDGLVEFLDGWLDVDRHEHALLWDMIRHEATLARMRKRMARGEGESPAAGAVAAAPRGASKADGVPVIAGVLHLHQMTFDPRILAERLRQQSPQLSDLQRGTIRLGYWWQGGTAGLAIVELDELAAHLLSLVDGASSVAALAEKLAHTGTPIPLQPLRGAFDELAQVGLITFHTHPGT